MIPKILICILSKNVLNIKFLLRSPLATMYITCYDKKKKSWLFCDHIFCYVLVLNWDDAHQSFNENKKSFKQSSSAEMPAKCSSVQHERDQNDGDVQSEQLEQTSTGKAVGCVDFPQSNPWASISSSVSKKKYYKEEHFAICIRYSIWIF